MLLALLAAKQACSFPCFLASPNITGLNLPGFLGSSRLLPFTHHRSPFLFFFSISLPVVCTLQERDGKELLSRCSRPSSVKCLGLHTARGSFAVFNSAMFHRWNMCVTYTIDVRFLWALGFSSFFLVAEAIDSFCVCVWLHLYTRECRTPFTVAHTWTLDGASRLRDVGRQVLTQSAARVSSFSLVFYSILISDRAAWFSSRPVHFRSVRSFVSFSPTSTCDGTESGSIAFAPSTADR